MMVDTAAPISGQPLRLRSPQSAGRHPRNIFSAPTTLLPTSTPRATAPAPPPRRSIALVTLLPLLLGIASYGILFQYIYHSGAAPTDERGYISLKVSLEEKRIIDAHRKSLRSMTLPPEDVASSSGTTTRTERWRRRLKEVFTVKKDKEKDDQQEKEEIQHELARKLLEEGLRLRAKKNHND